MGHTRLEKQEVFMENQRTQGAFEFLHTLVNQPLCYGLKSTDMDLYEFGFGKCEELSEESGLSRMICTLYLHVTHTGQPGRRGRHCRMRR